MRELEKDALIFAVAASSPDKSSAEALTEIEKGYSAGVVPEAATNTVIEALALPPPSGSPEKMPELL